MRGGTDAGAGAGAGAGGAAGAGASHTPADAAAAAAGGTAQLDILRNDSRRSISHASSIRSIDGSSPAERSGSRLPWRRRPAMPWAPAARVAILWMRAKLKVSEPSAESVSFEPRSRR